uniref:Thy-1 membrane glycoprotein n=2 Tax=Leptobrachium leishanense TaxID=445787 RepID=A0A8C5MR80_9ANUR
MRDRDSHLAKLCSFGIRPGLSLSLSLPPPPFTAAKRNTLRQKKSLPGCCRGKTDKLGKKVPKKMEKMNYLTLFTFTCLLFVFQTICGQKITIFTACLTGPGPKLRLDCRYQNITNNPLRYEFKVMRGGEPQVILTTIKPNFFSEKYHNRASPVISRGLVQLHLERFNASDVGLYTCALLIPNDLTINQTATIKVQKDKLERCEGVSILKHSATWLLLTLPFLQACGFLCF